MMSFRKTSVLACLAVLTVSSAAQAGVEFVEIQTTTLSIPAGASAKLRLQVSADGDVAALTAGPESTYLITAELGTGSTSTPYLFDGEAVVPFAATFGPSNDLIFRGVAGADMPVGVTTRMTLGGELVWEQPDSAFFDDESYLGVYQGPVSPMAWSPTAQRALIFTESSFEVAAVSQGSLLFEFNGDVRVPSITFGTEYIGATLANVMTMPNGKFFIYYFSQNDVGARFFTYDGISSISNWQPEGGDWTQRVVYFVQYDSAGNLVLLWNDLVDAADGAKAHLTKLDPSGRLLWDSDLSGSIEVEVDGVSERADMARPQFMVTGDDEILLLRAVGQAFYFDVRSSADGSPLGFYDFTKLTDNDVYDLVFLKQSDRNYLLSTVDPEASAPDTELLQIRLVVNDDPVEVLPPTNNPVAPVNNGANNGPIEGPPSEEPEPAIPRPSVGCGCVTPASTPAPDFWGLFVSALALGLVARRLPWT
jgi:hypothetical protein